MLPLKLGEGNGSIYNTNINLESRRETMLDIDDRPCTEGEERLTRSIYE